MYLNSHPPAFLCFPVSTSFSGCRRFLQTLLLSLKAWWVLHVSNQRVCVREKRRQILPRGCCCGLSLSSRSTSEGDGDRSWKSSQSRSPHILIPSLCFPLTWAWRSELGSVRDHSFELCGWLLICHLTHPHAPFSMCVTEVSLAVLDHISRPHTGWSPMSMGHKAKVCEEPLFPCIQDKSKTCCFWVSQSV